MATATHRTVIAQTQARVRRLEQRRIEEGSKRIPGGLLSPDAAAALESLVSSGYAPNKTHVINKALVEAASKLK